MLNWFYFFAWLGFVAHDVQVFEVHQVDPELAVVADVSSTLIAQEEASLVILYFPLIVPPDAICDSAYFLIISLSVLSNVVIVSTFSCFSKTSFHRHSAADCNAFPFVSLSFMLLIKVLSVARLLVFEKYSCGVGGVSQGPRPSLRIPCIFAASYLFQDVKVFSISFCCFLLMVLFSSPR